MCNKTFTCQYTYQTHMDSVHKSREHPCKYCSFKATSLQGLSIHFRRTHDQGAATCHCCGKIFETWAEMIHHRRKTVRIRCQVCGKVYSSSRTLAAHVNGVHKGTSQANSSPQSNLSSHSSSAHDSDHSSSPSRDEVSSEESDPDDPSAPGDSDIDGPSSKGESSPNNLSVEEESTPKDAGNSEDRPVVSESNPITRLEGEEGPDPSPDVDVEVESSHHLLLLDDEESDQGPLSLEEQEPERDPLSGSTHGDTQESSLSVLGPDVRESSHDVRMDDTAEPVFSHHLGETGSGLYTRQGSSQKSSSRPTSPEGPGTSPYPEVEGNDLDLQYEDPH